MRKSEGAISHSSALSKGVSMSPHETEWDKILSSSLYFHDLVIRKAMNDLKVVMAKMPKWRPPKCLKKFHAADRTSLLTCVSVEYEKHHEVLEMILTKNHCVGAPFSKKYTAIVECPDQEELIALPPPPPKGTAEQLSDSVKNLVRTVTLQPRIEEPELNRWEPVESQIFEIHLSQEGPITSHRLSKHLSVLSRRASVEEVRPYQVEFHISQKAWHQRMMIWMTSRAETAALHTNRYVTPNLSAQCGAPDLDGAIVLSQSMDSLHTAHSKNKKHVPIEIAVVNSGDRPKLPRTLFKAAASIDGIWIPDFDVVVGVPTKKATTLATEIMKGRVVPFFESKADLRPSQVQVMTLMLQEELKDEERFRNKDLPMANFWMKLADCDEDVRRKENLETKWLRKDSGDFVGPFVHASDSAIHETAIEWVNEYTLQRSQALFEEPRDPEPAQEPKDGVTAMFEETMEDEEEGATAHEMEEREPQTQERPKEIDFPTPSEGPPLMFNLTGPVETIDQKAREICQEWVNDSDTLLIKAAKKTLIDSFQTDFHSFLFLFQLQLKRIKEGYANDAGGGEASSVQGDDSSWVSAEPSVQEEDSRVADIESACVAFLNRMGNDMLRYYERLSGDKSSSGSVKEIREKQEVEDKKSEGGATLAAYLEKQTGAGSGGKHGRQSRSDPAEVAKAGASKLGEASLDLSTATTVQRFVSKRTVERSHSRTGLQPKGRSFDERPLSPREDARRRYEDDRDDSYDDGSLRSRDHPTYDESSFDDHTLDATFEEETEEEEFSYESRRRGRGRHSQRRRRDCRDRPCDFDYDSPNSRSRSYADDDTYPTVGTGPLDTLTLSPSELSLDERKTKQQPTWGIFNPFGL